MLPTAEWNVPDLDAITHDQLKAWINQATTKQLWQAIFAGREWLANFTPETEDDETLPDSVRERIEILEEAYKAREDQ